MGVFIKWGTQNGWFTMDNPIKMVPFYIPPGYFRSYRESSFLIGQSSETHLYINGPFSMAMLNNQRVIDTYLYGGFCKWGYPIAGWFIPWKIRE